MESFVCPTFDINGNFSGDWKIGYTPYHGYMLLRLLSDNAPPNANRNSKKEDVYGC